MSALLDRIMRQQGDICAAKHGNNPESVEAKNLTVTLLPGSGPGLPKPFAAAPAGCGGLFRRYCK
jgi:hypothetical protein